MEQQMKIIADAVNEIMRQTLADRDEIERLREALFKLDRVAKDSYGSPAYGSMASSFVQSIVSKALGEKE